jgi:hypothetical protein
LEVIVAKSKKQTPWFLNPIVLGGTTIEVVFNDGQAEFGTWTQWPRPTISLGNQHHSEVAGTLLHEILHGISDLYELGLSEAQVKVLEQTVIAALRQNPQLAQHLLHGK